MPAIEGKKLVVGKGHGADCATGAGAAPGLAPLLWTNQYLSPSPCL